MCEFDEREAAEETDPREDVSTDPLSAHFGLVAVAIALGWLLQQG